MPLPPDMAILIDKRRNGKPKRGDQRDSSVHKNSPQIAPSQEAVQASSGLSFGSVSNVPMNLSKHSKNRSEIHLVTVMMVSSVR